MYICSRSRLQWKFFSKIFMFETNHKENKIVWVYAKNELAKLDKLNRSVQSMLLQTHIAYVNRAHESKSHSLQTHEKYLQNIWGRIWWRMLYLIETWNEFLSNLMASVRQILNKLRNKWQTQFSCHKAFKIRRWN